MAELSMGLCIKSLNAQQRFEPAQMHYRRRLNAWRDSLIFWKSFTKEYIRINKYDDTDNFLKSLDGIVDAASIALIFF